MIDERAEIMDNDIRLVAIGELDRLPAYAREPLDALMRDSAGNRGMTLCLALSYGGRESIVAAARALGESVASGEITAEEITEEKLTASLQTGGLPQLDLLVRTSGEERLSNFLLWEAAYAELYFTETFWPAFGKAELYRRSSRSAGASAGSVARASRSAARAERAGPCRTWRCGRCRRWCCCRVVGALILWQQPLGFGALVLLVSGLALHECAAIMLAGAPPKFRAAIVALGVAFTAALYLAPGYGAGLRRWGR